MKRCSDPKCELGKITEWFEEDGPPLKRREEKLDSDCPLAMAAEQYPKLSIPSPIGKQPSGVGLGGGHQIRVQRPY